MFEIYSIGDSAFLEQILIAVAMVTGTDSFSHMIRIGLLIGIIMIFVQGLFQGAKQVNFQQILLGYLLYAMLFVPTVTVDIEDAFTGQVRRVANVPLGIGAAGGIISSIGYNITNLFEQGYGAITPYVTESHFVESLKILNDTRRRISSTPVYAAMNAGIGTNADVRKSWNNYIRECSLTAIDLGVKNLDEMMGGAIPQTFRFDSNLYGTRLYIGGSASGTDYTCSEAYTRLVNATNTAINSTPVSNALLNVLGVSNTATGVTGQSYISSALASLGRTSSEGTAYLTAAVLEPIYYEAAQGRYADFHDMASATMINQAIQQRNSQWAAEQSMFLTIVRPMITFFEGFVYAITPLMGFLVVLGSFGMGIAGKYFQTLLWIQLWMPVMSIINLYIHTAASNELSSIGSNLTSIYALNSTSDQLQHWIATGGMLASATPLISLFVVTGSTYAFTSLAGRISGKDHIDEKVSSKDLVSSGPVMQASASSEYSDLTGMAASGAAGLMGSISFGSGLSSMTSSAHQQLSSAQQAFSSSLGSNFSSNTMSGQTYDKAASLGRTHSAMHGRSEGIVNERANQIMENTSIGSQHADAVKGIVSAVASGAISGSVGTSMISQLAEGVSASYGVSRSTPIDPGNGEGSKASRTESAQCRSTRSSTMANKFGVDAGAEAKLSASANKETTDSLSSSANESAAISKALRFSQQEQSQVSNNLAKAVSTGNTESLNQTLGHQETKALTQSAQNLVSSNDSYSQADSLNQQYGALNNLRLRDLGSQIGGNSQAMSDLNSYWNTGGVGSETKAEAQRLYERYSTPSTEGGYGLDNNSALAAARIKALQNSNNHTGTSDQQYQNNFNAALNAVGTGMGLATGQAGGYDSKSGLQQVGNNGLNTEVQNATAGVGAAVSGAGAITMPKAGYPTHSDPAASSSTPNVIDHEGAVNSASVRNTGAGWQNTRNAEAEAGARRQLLNNGPEYSRMSASEFYGGVENASDWVGRRMQEAENFGESVFNAANAGMNSGSASFGERLDQLKNDPALRQEIISAARMSDAELESSGVGGSILSGLSSMGRSIMGAAAAGMELAQGEIGFDDLKNMSFEEKGMVYEAALSHAMETGGQAAVQAFEQTHGANFREEFYDEAMSRGLTHEQAQVYSQSFDMNVLGNSPERQSAIQDLATTYAQRDSHDNVMRNDSGSPVLTEQNQEFVDHMVHTITESARAGSSMSGSYMTGIAHYNNATGRNGGVF